MSFRFLVVDDSSIVRKMIEKALRLSGLAIDQVVHAGDGQAALDALAGNWVDLVFADINMPVMNGEQMIERLRADAVLREIPIVVVSTEGSETRIERLRQLGVNGYLRKPFKPDEFRDLVTKLLGVATDAHAE